jgi:hypothetical protein
VVQRRKFLQWWGFGHEFSWHGSQTELPLCHKPESFTDCRRFAPWAESEAFGCRQPTSRGAHDFDRLNPNRFAIRFSEWPIRCGTEDLRDWRGGLLLRCSPALANSPASCCGPIFDCLVSLASGSRIRIVARRSGLDAHAWPARGHTANGTGWISSAGWPARSWMR